MVKLVPTPSAKSDPDAVQNPHSDTIADVIRTLLNTLPPDQQEQVLKELTQTLRLIPASRAGEVLGEIVRLIPRSEEFSVQDIKKRIGERGVEASPKAVYNALAYLKLKGKVRRVGYGRYIVDGAAIDTSDDFGEASARNEDESSG